MSHDATYHGDAPWRTRNTAPLAADRPTSRAAGIRLTPPPAWAILSVHRRDGSSTDLVVLDASRFASPRVARVRSPCRVPLGLHGGRLPDAAA
ncbi:carotenoid oxygenase family protein [Sorangium sp. So ce260]|uniref:carotenoid oxygenase family protein n=1 Tax=Sorangium sp. So ce260 TaxID=3133291 RepID=UPI003F60BDC4